MTLLWFAVWLTTGQDPVTFSPAVNDWGTVLLAAIGLDLVGGYGS